MHRLTAYIRLEVKNEIDLFNFKIPGYFDEEKILKKAKSIIRKLFLSGIVKYIDYKNISVYAKNFMKEYSYKKVQELCERNGYILRNRDPYNNHQFHLCAWTDDYENCTYTIGHFQRLSDIVSYCAEFPNKENLENNMTDTM